MQVILGSCYIIKVNLHINHQNILLSSDKTFLDNNKEFLMEINEKEYGVDKNDHFS